jgi:hypothetical protein
MDLGMIQKVRPALVLNRSFKDNDRALITVIPHTTALRGSELEIRFNVPFLQPGAFLVQNPTLRGFEGQTGLLHRLALAVAISLSQYSYCATTFAYRIFWRYFMIL